MGKINAKLGKIREIENENRRKAETKAKQEAALKAGQQQEFKEVDFYYSYKKAKLDLAKKEAEINAKYEAEQKAKEIAKKEEEKAKIKCSQCHLTFEHQNDFEKHLEENHLFLSPDYEDQES